MAGGRDGSGCLQASLAEKVEGKHPCKRLVPAEAGDPITRICPLTGPNEAMAYEVQMEAWFTRME